jgi:hypothetical protein
LPIHIQTKLLALILAYSQVILYLWVLPCIEWAQV